MKNHLPLINPINYPFWKCFIIAFSIFEDLLNSLLDYKLQIYQI